MRISSPDTSLTINVQNRIRLTFVVVLILGIALSSFVYLNGRSVLQISEPLLSKQLPALSLISDLQLEVAAQAAILHEYYATIDRDLFRKQFDDNSAAIKRDISILSGGLIDDQHFHKVREYSEMVDKLARELDETLGIYGTGSVDWDRARALLVEVSTVDRQITDELDILATSIRTAVSVAGVDTRQRIDSVVTAVLAFSVLIGVILLLIGLYISAYLSEADERHKLAMFVEKNPNPVLRLSPSGEVMYANPALLKMLNEQGLGDVSISALLPDDIGDRQVTMLHDNQITDQFEYRSNGLTIDCRLCYLPEHGVFHCYLSDVTARRQAEARLREQALHDTLTGLPNRRFLQEEIAALQESQTFGLMLINFDDFHRLISDVGPEMVDELLCAVSLRLSQHFPPRSSRAQLYRFEGGTFALLVPIERNAPEPAKIAERVLVTLRDPFHVGGRMMFLSTSIGVVLFPEHGRHTSDMVRHASMALSAVKHAEGGAFRIFSAQMSASAKERLAMESDLRNAIEHNELFLHFQPQVDLSSGRVIAGEALLRWERADYGLVSPAQFIPVAEQTGLIGTIGDWVVERSCKTAFEWQRQNRAPVGVAVNLSARQLRNPALVARISQILQETGLSPECLELEITESSAMDDVERTIHLLAELKELGVMLAIDDFGTGFSSMSYLSRFPIDRLKIDKSFVQGLGSEKSANAITEAVITLGHSLHLKVIAEGVETESQLEALRELGCDEIQGFLLSKPVHNDAFSTLLDKDCCLLPGGVENAARFGLRSASTAV